LEVFENQVNNNNQTGSAIDTVDIIVKDVNVEAMNRALQQEDVNIIDQSDQGELQDEGTTGDDGKFSADAAEDEDGDELGDEDDDDSDSEEEVTASDESEDDGGDDDGGGDEEG
jgi:hypothetical protein